MATAEVIPPTAMTNDVIASTPTIAHAKKVLPRASLAQRNGFRSMGNTKTTHTDAVAFPVMATSGSFFRTLTANGKRMFGCDVVTQPGVNVSNTSGTMNCKDGVLHTVCTAESVHKDTCSKFQKGLIKMSDVKDADKVVYNYEPEEVIRVLCFDHRSDKPIPAFCNALLFGPTTKQYADTKTGEIKHSMSGESLAVKDRMSWNQIEAHPVFRNNANGANDCIIINSSANDMPSNQLLSVECRDTYKRKDAADSNDKDQKEKLYCIFEFFVVSLDVNPYGELERVALKFTGWDSSIAATFNITDSAIWPAFRNIITSHPQFEMAVASNLDFKEPSTSAVALFLGTDSSASEDVRAIPSNPTAQNRKVTGLAVNWRPLLNSFFPAKATIALALLGEDTDLTEMETSFSTPVGMQKVGYLNKDYITATASLTSINTDNMQLADLGNNELLYGTCYGPELVALNNMHPESEFDREYYILPTAATFKTNVEELKGPVLNAGGAVGPNGAVLISAHDLYATNLAHNDMALVDFRPTTGEPVFVFATFKRRSAETKRPAEAPVVAAASAAPAAKRSKKEKSAQ